jgi:hypothetical protein
MKLTLTSLVLLFLLLLPSMSGQETKVTISENGATKVIACTNGGNLQLVGEVWVQEAIAPCTDSSCKQVAHEKIAAGVHVPPGKVLTVFCSTKAEDEQTARDTEFCRNNVSNPRPESEAEVEKWRSEFFQCLKDRAEFRRQKEH